MTRKKVNYLLVLLLTIVSLGANAQTTKGYDAMDQSYVPKNKKPQYAQFINNAYPYPARPKNMWEIGVAGSYSHIISSLRANQGLGVSVSARKALGHTLSLRFEAGISRTTGIGVQRSSRKYSPVDPWLPYTNEAASYIPNFENKTIHGDLDLLVSLGNINFYHRLSKINVYGLLGYGFMIVDVNVNALKENAMDKKYSFTPPPGSSPKQVRKYLRDQELDKTYESNAPRSPEDKVLNDNQLLKHAINGGVGFQYLVSPRFSIGLEQKLSLPTISESIDGLATNDEEDLSRVNMVDNKKIYSYTSLRLGFHFGNSSKRTLPLWWVNPLDYVYNELNNPRHMKIPGVMLPDGDGDGVTDQFDLEPNTPKGVPVDVHGVSRDTDGDGVPDYKDKELITPTKCMPVDADGVGNCPDPECCKNKTPQGCSIGNLPSISFKSGSILTSDAKAMLANVAEKMRNSPECSLDVVGFSKKEQSSSKVQAVINYLVDQLGIQSSRISPVYTNDGMDKDVVDLRARQ